MSDIPTAGILSFFGTRAYYIEFVSICVPLGEFTLLILNTHTHSVKWKLWEDTPVQKL